MSYHKDITVIKMDVPHGTTYGEISNWLHDHFGDRDVGMARWKHHHRKGQSRRYWDRYMHKDNWIEGHTATNFHFGTKEMAMLFKLRWGGQ